MQGYRNMDAYSPIPIEELNEALGLRRTRLPMLVLLGGILGGLGGYGLEYWSQVDRVPDEHRRPAASQLAALHPGDLRDDGARRGAGARLSACGRSTGCRCRTTRCSTCRRSRARRATGSFCASRRPIRGSTATRRRSFSRACIRWECPKLRRRTFGRCTAPSCMRAASPGAAGGVPPGHARRAALRAARGEHFFADGRGVAACPWPTPWRAARCARTSTCTGQDRRPARGHVPDAGDRGGDGARPGALQRVLLAVPRADRAGQRHGGAARVPRAAVVPRGAAAQRAGRLLLRRDDERLRRDADYAAQVPVADRWAIAAYIRALQFSQRATVDDVPADRRGGPRSPGRGRRAPAPRSAAERGHAAQEAR